MTRISRLDYYMEVAKLTAKRSTCLHTHVGAVLVREGRIIMTSYNGHCSGFPHCEICLREKLKVPQGQRMELCRAIHAEANSLIICSRVGIFTENATMYTTHRPCYSCLKMLINAGVRKVVFERFYKDEMVDELMGSEEMLNLQRQGKGIYLVYVDVEREKENGTF